MKRTLTIFAIMVGLALGLAMLVGLIALGMYVRVFGLPIPILVLLLLAATIVLVFLWISAEAIFDSLRRL